MKIKLQNKYIVPLVPFLEGMKLKGEQSRARSKFLKLVYAAFAELHDSEVELMQEFAVTDGDGKPVCGEDGSFRLRDGTGSEYLTEREKLFCEIAEIEGGTYTSHLETMRLILTGYDEDLDGDNAALYDALLDAFEEVDASDDE